VSLIEIEDLRFSYADTSPAVLDGFDITAEAGEWLCLVGPNGSGKSTLARLLAGLERPRSAKVARVAGHDLLLAGGRSAARRDVGILFQNPDNQIVGSSVEEDLAFGLENLGLPTMEIRLRVDEALDSFALGELALREPHLLSGGQKQRTALAGVLAIPRRILILDEPTAMLDPVGRDEVLAALARVREQGLTVVYVTQEMAEVRAGDRVVALLDGRCVFDGGVESLFADAGLLQRLSLGLPPAADVALALGERGRHGGRLPLTIDDLVDMIRGKRDDC
jgi:energy-coupling factor transport system ATP-binding protein